jgi:hypothetical protein
MTVAHSLTWYQSIRFSSRTLQLRASPTIIPACVRANFFTSNRSQIGVKELLSRVKSAAPIWPSAAPIWPPDAPIRWFVVGSAGCWPDQVRLLLARGSCSSCTLLLLALARCSSRVLVEHQTQIADCLVPSVGCFKKKRRKRLGAACRRLHRAMLRFLAAR